MLCSDLFHLYPLQPSQNVPAAGNLAAYNKMSAAYFIVKFTNNKYDVSYASYYSSHLAYYMCTLKHFDWAALAGWWGEIIDGRIVAATAPLQADVRSHPLTFIVKHI